ncbi:MAG: hypothetical protein AB7U75_01705 [Hyphomicrobiaceae bacterium]
MQTIKATDIPMLELLASVAQRPVVAVLAIAGALLVSAGALVASPDPKAPPRPSAQYLTVAGYALTIASIFLFIAAGFLSGR